MCHSIEPNFISEYNAEADIGALQLNQNRVLQVWLATALSARASHHSTGKTKGSWLGSGM